MLFWRHERLPIPTVYLYDGDLAESLQDALELTETTAGHLNRTMTGMARDLLGIKGDRPRKAESNRMREITPASGCGTRLLVAPGDPVQAAAGQSAQ